jgi:hypothetical protein
MKSLAALGMAFSFALTALAGPVWADEESATDGAKSLFFEQMDHPNDKMNTGIQYWIELTNNGRTVHANNKTSFHTGDKIRFHLKPNIDGYAYIVLRSGSKGEKAVLFPDASIKEENHIKRGREIVLPTDGFLTFDENPGTEKLTLLISRKPIDADAFLSDKKQDNAPNVVAMAAPGCKDLIPNQVLVSYIQPASMLGAIQHAGDKKPASDEKKTTIASKPPVTNKVTDEGKAAAESKAADTKTADNSKQKKNTVTYKPAGPGKTESNSSSKSDESTKPAPAHHNPKVPKHEIAKHKPVNARHQDVATNQNLAKDGDATAKTDSRTASNDTKANDDKAQSGMVTVVFTNPNDTLAADITLQHL